MPSALRTHHGFYVSFPDGNVGGNADRGDQEMFDFEDVDGGVALKTSKGYVQAAPDGVPLYYADEVGDWGKFERIDAGDGKINLKALSNGKYVAANPDGQCTNDRDNAAEWEAFVVEDA